MVSGAADKHDRRKERTNGMIQKSWGVLLLRVPEFEMFLKLARHSGIYTIWTANLIITDNTRATHDSNRTLKGPIPAGDGGYYYKFDTCTKLHRKGLYMCNKH